MNRIALTLVAAAALGACETSFTSPALRAPLSASRAIVENDHFESVVFGFNSCNGDFLDGTGKIHIVLGITDDGAGGFHATFHQQLLNLKLTGSPSGAEYVGSQQVNEAFNIAAGQEVTFVSSSKIIGKGATPNEILQSTFHVTINANGEVTSSHSDFSFDCH